MTQSRLKLHNVEQGSEAWLKLRAGLYTGHNAHKLLSHHGKVKVVNGVVSAYALSEITGFGGNFWTRRGHSLELEATRIYEAVTKTKVAQIGFVTNTRYPQCGYSPDGLPPVALLEIKSFDIPQHLKLLAGEIPITILAQVHFGLLITERPFAHLVPYCPKFAKRKLPNGMDNPDYDPQRAFKIITIKANRNIAGNFKRILSIKEAAHAGN